MNFDEWYRANIGVPGKYPENTEHFRAAFEAGMAHQRELDAALLISPQQSPPPVQRERRHRNL